MKFKKIARLFMAGWAASALCSPPDIANSRDHPLVSRIPESVIVGYEAKDYDRHLVALGPAITAGRAKDNLAKEIYLEGRTTRIVYRMPAGISPFQASRTYEVALQKNGFRTQFACSDKECGTTTWFQSALYKGRGGAYVDLRRPWKSQRYVSTKLVRSGADVTVTIFANEPDHLIDPVTRQPLTWTEIAVVEEKPLDSGLVTVNAEMLADGVHKTGHVAVYGIYFDTGGTEIKPESDATLREIALLLRNQARLKLHVVGHTDSVGSLEANLDLSRRRAQAIVNALVRQHGVALERLRPEGVGPLSPVMSNSSEEGRAKNRRVELVEQ